MNKFHNFKISQYLLFQIHCDSMIPLMVSKFTFQVPHKVKTFIALTVKVVINISNKIQHLKSNTDKGDENFITPKNRILKIFKACLLLKIRLKGDDVRRSQDHNFKLSRAFWDILWATSGHHVRKNPIHHQGFQCQPYLD